MGKINSRAKGNRFELELAKTISSWWTGKDLSDKRAEELPFRRAPLSGGWDKRAASADLIVADASQFEHPFPFSVECFTEDTLVHTKAGLVPICEIRIGDKVLTHKGRWRRVTATMQREAQQIVEVHHEGSRESIKCSVEHPYEDIDGNWIPAKSVKHVMLMGMHHQQSENTTLWLDTEQAEVRESVSPGYCACGCGKACSASGSKGRTRRFLTGHGAKLSNPRKPIPMKVEVTDSLLFVLGAYIAEGHSAVDRVVFSIHEDENKFAAHIKQGVEEAFGIPCSADRVDEGTKSRHLIYDSRALADTFKAWLGTGSSTKSLRGFWRLPRDKLRHLLAGCWEGDGHFSDVAKYTTVSRILAYEMQASLMVFGVTSHVTRDDRPDRAPVYSVDVHKACHARLSSILNRASWESSPINENPNLTRVATHRYLSRATVTPAEDRATVYNISVDEDETYVVGSGVVVHNCKNQECWNFDQIWNDKWEVKAYWDQCCEAARKSKLIPLVLFTRKRQPIFYAIPRGLALARHDYLLSAQWLPFVIGKFDDLLAVPPQQIVEALGTPAKTLPIPMLPYTEGPEADEADRLINSHWDKKTRRPILPRPVKETFVEEWTKIIRTRK